MWKSWNCSKNFPNEKDVERLAPPRLLWIFFYFDNEQHSYFLRLFFLLLLLLFVSHLLLDSTDCSIIHIWHTLRDKSKENKNIKGTHGA